MKNKPYTYLFLILVTLYLGMVVRLPSDPVALERYHITQSKAHLLGLTIAIPLTLVWLAALYGFLRFKSYADTVSETREGLPFRYLANGLMVLAFSLPITSIISSLLTYMAVHNRDLLPLATIMRNYLNLIFPLIAFTLLAKGADGLVKFLRPIKTLPYPRYSSLGLIIASSLYTFLIIGRPWGGAGGDMVYFLPTWVVVLTIAIPGLYIWHKGALAAYRLYIYKQKVKGVVYKNSFSDLLMGLGTIVVLSISLQIMLTLSERLNRLHLTPLLIIIYILVATYAVGYGLVARGAQQLKKIEEV